jgi:hypothetical protein
MLCLCEGSSRRGIERRGTREKEGLGIRHRLHKNARRPALCHQTTTPESTTMNTPPLAARCTPLVTSPTDDRASGGHRPSCCAGTGNGSDREGKGRRSPRLPVATLERGGTRE